MERPLKRKQATGGEILKHAHPLDSMLRTVPVHSHIVQNGIYKFNCSGYTLGWWLGYDHLCTRYFEFSVSYYHYYCCYYSFCFTLLGDVSARVQFWESSLLLALDFIEGKIFFFVSATKINKNTTNILNCYISN